MLLGSILVISLFSGAFSNECIKYTFDEGFYDLFNNNVGPCSERMLFWEQREYSSIGIEDRDNNSRHFVSPGKYLSCISSFPFTMSAGGVIEVTVYIGSHNILDQVTVMASKTVPNGVNDADELVLTQTIDPASAKGWETFIFQLSGAGTFTGYLSFMGVAARQSTILVDSFRYIPPNHDGPCIEYEDQATVTTKPTVTEDDTTPTKVDEEVPTTQSSVITSNPTIPTVIVTEPTTVPTEPEMEFLANGCPVDPHVHWLVPDKKNCTLFYYCVWGATVQRYCPSNLHFNPVLQVCDWPLSAGCTLN